MMLRVDYDYTCNYLKGCGAVLRCNRVCIAAKLDINAGGACSTRDSEGQEEQHHINVLREKWRNAVKAKGGGPRLEEIWVQAAAVVPTRGHSFIMWMSIFHMRTG